MIETLAIIVLKSTHLGFIAGAWAIAVFVLLGVLLQSLVAARRNRARLAMLEKMAPRRRQGSGVADEPATGEEEDA